MAQGEILLFSEQSDEFDEDDDYAGDSVEKNDDAEAINDDDEDNLERAVMILCSCWNVIPHSSILF